MKVKKNNKFLSRKEKGKKFSTDKNSRKASQNKGPSFWGMGLGRSLYHD